MFLFDTDLLNFVTDIYLLVTIYQICIQILLMKKKLSNSITPECTKTNTHINDQDSTTKIYQNYTIETFESSYESSTFVYSLAR